ncbi:hypothetical protein RD792_000558 [Penstemon davidsonii]|uniref:CCHC-type domain-containing protein n=1 Tax=Penstemon davidsonii TaxID=160366 RepID=A0ABR0DLR1_9LAMI|nr:hypothetical protein RD792_000558 [Penstemon davidsonii]
MAGRGNRRKPKVNTTPVRERDLRDVEMDDLRRQVEQLQQRLLRFETKDHDVSHDSEGDASYEDEETNPFADTRSRISSDSSKPRQRTPRQNLPREYDVKVDIPEFAGKINAEEFSDWLHTVERIFDYKDVPDDRKVKLVAIKLTKYASIWWEHLKNRRAREGKSRIVTWDKMKKELKKKFLPDNYRQDIFLKLHNFQQKDLTVEEYSAEFDHLLMCCDIVEPEEQTIARYLGGLRTEIRNVIQLQPYWTYNDVFKLAIKVEKQLKEAHGSGFRSWAKESSTSKDDNEISNPLPTKTNLNKHDPKSEIINNSTRTKSNSPNSRKCFKCQGFGHIASECPNRKIVSLVEENFDEELEEETNKEEDENEITFGDQGESLIIHRCLSSAKVGEDTFLEENIFHTTSLSKVYDVVFEGPPTYDESEDDEFTVDDRGELLVRPSLDSNYMEEMSNKPFGSNYDSHIEICKVITYDNFFENSIEVTAESALKVSKTLNAKPQVEKYLISEIQKEVAKGSLDDDPLFIKSQHEIDFIIGESYIHDIRFFSGCHYAHWMEYFKSSKLVSCSIQDFHIQLGALVANYPWDGTDDRKKNYFGCPDDETFRYMASLYSRSHYNMSLSKEFPGGITNGALWYPIYGGMQDWNYIHYGCFELTLEISDNKWPNASELPTLWEYNRMSMLNIVASLVKTGIHGRIFSSDGGRPLPASIAIRGINYTITASKLFADYHRLVAPREKYEVIATMPGYKSKSTCIVLGEAAATVDFVLDPETNYKGGELVLSSNCDFENNTSVQVMEFLPVSSQLEISVVLILILAFLCFLMKRRVKSNHLNQRQTLGPKRAVV